ncbi:hypothetical protein NXS19_010915 [Fusarium pseudograminearum]|nr:hypothetical protein NXS19_010915 [Fusarium pseudograminearum]
MDQQQLLPLRNDLQDHADPEKWGHQIQNAPECIILMARCKLLMSQPSITALDIHVKGLKYTSLRVNIRECAQLGQDALRKTAEQMGTANCLAYDMAKDSGIIDSIQRYTVNDRQSLLWQRRREEYIKRGRNNVAKSVRIIAELKQDYVQWNEVTKILLSALEQKTTDSMKEKKDTEKRLAERQRRSHSAPQIDVGEPYKGVYGCEGKQPWNELGLTGAAVMAVGVPVLIQAALSAGLPGRMDYLQENIKVLDDRVNDLHDEIGSTIGMKKLLEETLQDLSNLQKQVEHFMDFLIGIQRVMDNIQDEQGLYLMEGMTPDDQDQIRQDHETRRDYANDGELMRSKFMTAYKATTLYNEVSNTYIRPGVSWLTGLCFDDTEADFKKGILEIEEKRNELCGGAKELVDRRINEIRIDLKVVDPVPSAKETNDHVEEVTENDQTQQDCY